MKRKNIIYSIIGLGIIYLISLKLFAKRISENCGIRINSKRNEIGIPKLNENWKIDSICSFQNDYRKIKTEPSIFVNDVYLLIWSNVNDVDTLIAFHKTKEIYYENNFLLWKNRIILEIDNFINPFSKEQYAELRISYDYVTKKKTYTIDTLKTEYAKRKFKQELKIASEKGLHICGFTTGDSFPLKLPTEINEKEKEIILQNWNLK